MIIPELFLSHWISFTVSPLFLTVSLCFSPSLPHSHLSTFSLWVHNVFTGISITRFFLESKSFTYYLWLFKKKILFQMTHWKLNCLASLKQVTVGELFYGKQMKRVIKRIRIKFYIYEMIWVLLKLCVLMKIFSLVLICFFSH